MRARVIALVGLVAAGGLAGAADPAAELQQFASSAGRYKVLFPGPVRSETTEVKTPAGPATLTLDSVKAGGVTYLVSYVDTSDEVAKAPAGPRLEKVRDATKGADGVLESDKELAVGDAKYPAREVVVVKPDGAVRSRIVIAGNRLYQVIARGPREAVAGPGLDRFFASFEVTK